MGKIVFFCIPAWGHTNPTLGVVRELVRRGHEVWYYSYDLHRSPIEAAGAHFVSCNAFDAEQRLSPADGARVARDMAFAAKILVDTTLALDETVDRHMEELRPDCIVADSMAVWGKAVALKKGIPFVSSTTTFAFNQHSAQVMKRSPAELIKLLFSLPLANRQVRRLQKRGYPVKSILDILQNDNDTHTIVYTSPQFQPCADTFSDRYAFVGPVLRPATAPVEKTAPVRIYLSMGTVNNDLLPLYRDCIAHLAKPGRELLLSVGDQVPLTAFGTLPENVRIFPKVDQIAVLEQTDVFLTHCGMNSASEGLSFGVPLLLLPQTTEQDGVATRVEALGAGLRPENQTGPAIAAAVEKLLSDPSYRENAQTMGDSFRSCPGPAGAADKIEAVMAE